MLPDAPLPLAQPHPTASGQSTGTGSSQLGPSDSSLDWESDSDGWEWDLSEHGLDDTGAPGAGGRGATAGSGSQPQPRLGSAQGAAAGAPQYPTSSHGEPSGGVRYRLFSDNDDGSSHDSSSHDSSPHDASYHEHSPWGGRVPPASPSTQPNWGPAPTDGEWEHEGFDSGLYSEPMERLAPTLLEPDPVEFWRGCRTAVRACLGAERPGRLEEALTQATVGWWVPGCARPGEDVEDG